MKTLDDYIMIIDDIISQNVIDELMEEYKNSNEWLIYNKGAAGGKEPATSILISHPKVIKQSSSRKKIQDDIVSCLAIGFDKYHEKHSRREQGLNFLAIKQLVGLRLIKYKKGQSLNVHTDKYTDPDTGVEIWPAVTFTLNVNENFSGGELNLLDGAYRIEAKAGRITFFPSNFLFPHAVDTVTRGIRYALVGWFV